MKKDERREEESLEERIEASEVAEPPCRTERHHESSERLLQELRVYQSELEIQNEELRCTQEALRESLDKFHDLFHFAPVGYVVLDHTNRILEANRTFLEMVQRPMAKVKGRAFVAFVGEADRGPFRARYKALFKKPLGKHAEVELLSGDQSLWVQLQARTADHASISVGDQPRTLLLTVTDITDRKRAEERKAHLERVLMAIRSVNQLIVQEVDSLELIRKTCARLTDMVLGYHNVWIVLLDADGRSVTSACSYFDVETGNARVRLEKGDVPDYLKRALEHDRALVLKRPPKLPGHFASAQFIGRSVLVCRLDHGGKIYGTLAVSIPESLASDAEEKALFEELSRDLSFGLHKIESGDTLRLSEEKFSKAFQTSPYIVTVTRAEDGRFIDVNDAFSAVSGFSREEAISDSSIGLRLWVNENDRNRVVSALSKGEIVSGEEFLFRRKDGEVITGLFSAQTINIDNEVCVLSSINDISERRRIEKALQVLAECGDRSGDAICRVMVREAADLMKARMALIARINPINSCKADTKVAYSVDGFVDNFSYSLEGGPCQHLMLQGTCFYPSNVKNLFPDNSMLVGLNINSYWGTTLRNSHDNVIGIFAVMSNNDMHKQTPALDVLRSFAARAAIVLEHEDMMADLKERESRYRLTTKAGRVGVWDWNMSTGDMYIDPILKQLLGYEDHEIRNHIQDWAKHIHPDDVEGVLQSVREAIRGDTPELFAEHKMTCKDGSIRYFLARGSAIRDTNGRAYRMVGTDSDITNRKLGERERERLQAQLTQAHKMESIGRLAGGVAHDFNNMLGVILGHTELALGNMDASEPLSGHLMEVAKAARRSADLTRQLLAFARQQPITPRVLDLNATVEGTLKMLRRLIGEDIRLSWLPGDNLWHVKLDPSQVDQILANLCVNARDAISGAGEVIIETGNMAFNDQCHFENPDVLPGDFVVLAVSDNGYGMDKETLNNLFEPFFTTKAPGEGTGLGLATVYGIVKQNRGFVNVYSEPGSGTTFKIYLPRQIDEIKPFDGLKSVEHVVRGSDTILLVEDEPAILDLTKIMLTRLGYSVLSASTPESAIQIAKNYNGRIDLLITDVIMPEMNGRELSERIFTMYPSVRTLFISGYTADVIAHHGVLDEGVHFIQKPFSISNLATKVREALAAST